MAFHSPRGPFSSLLFQFSSLLCPSPLSLVNFIAGVVINFCRETWLSDLVVNSSGIIKETYMLPKLPQSCPILCDPMDCSLPGSSVTGVGFYALLQGIFPTQGLNPCLLCHLHWQVGSLPLAPPGKPTKETHLVKSWLCHLCDLRQVTWLTWIFSSSPINWRQFYGSQRTGLNT